MLRKQMSVQLKHTQFISAYMSIFIFQIKQYSSSCLAHPGRTTIRASPSPASI